MRCVLICMQRINRALQTLFLSLAILFFLLAGGVRSKICNKVGAPSTRPCSLFCSDHALAVKWPEHG